MTRLAAAAQSVLANLGYRVEVGENFFSACYLGAGAVAPVAWLRTESGGWLVAIAKHLVPRLTEDSLAEEAIDIRRPDDAAFIVVIPNRDRLYGVFELIAAAYIRHPEQMSAKAEVGGPHRTSTLLNTLDELLKDDSEIPPTTVIKLLRDVRIGQNHFRTALLEHWGYACAVTGLDIPRLLRASHCKPWAVSSARERLDPNNGLLLAAHLDAAFDAGYISFADDGAMLLSPQFPASALQASGLCTDLRLRHVLPSHRPYLQWHRTHIFLTLTARPEFKG